MKIELKLIVEGEGQNIFYGEANNSNEVRWKEQVSNSSQGRLSLSSVDYNENLFKMQKRLIEFVEEKYPDKNYSLILNVNR